MKHFYVMLLSSLTAIVVSSSAIAETKNLTTQQYRVDSLQDKFNVKKRSFDRSTELIREQEQRIFQLEKSLAEEKTLLEKRKQKQAVKSEEMLKVQAKLEEEERILNMIWDKTHRTSSSAKSH